MALGQRPLPWEREWAALQRREERLLRKRRQETPSKLGARLEDKVPARLQDTLRAAFRKAFSMVLDKGDPLVEKTVSRQKRETDYQVNLYAAGVRRDKASLRAFSRQAGRSSRRNLALSGVEGVGLGLLGIGIPDIPLFTGVLLKSLYEIALSYGFAYDTPSEQRFLLKTLAVSLLRGEDFEEGNAEVNRWVYGEIPPQPTLQQLSDQAGEALAGELLYLKLLQGIPIVGVAGGLADSVCLKRVTYYAKLKYHRRFLRQFRKL